MGPPALQSRHEVGAGLSPPGPPHRSPKLAGLDCSLDDLEPAPGLQEAEL